MKVTIFSDGGARGNPGPAGIGAVLTDESEQTVAEVSEYIGETTNNQAEYRALLAGLEKAKELGATDVSCFLDSELVVNQLNRKYKVKDKDLAPLFVQIHNLTIQIGSVTFQHVPREKNTHAGALVNKAIDAQV